MVWHDCGAAKFKATKHNLIWKVYVYKVETGYQ